jgi:hypothetical protein
VNILSATPWPVHQWVRTELRGIRVNRLVARRETRRTRAAYKATTFLTYMSLQTTFRHQRSYLYNEVYSEDQPCHCEVRIQWFRASFCLYRQEIGNLRNIRHARPCKRLWIWGAMCYDWEARKWHSCATALKQKLIKLKREPVNHSSEVPVTIVGDRRWRNHYEEGALAKGPWCLRRRPLSRERLIGLETTREDQL